MMMIVMRFRCPACGKDFVVETPKGGMLQMPKCDCIGSISDNFKDMDIIDVHYRFYGEEVEVNKR